jgi:hypothetical protein
MQRRFGKFVNFQLAKAPFSWLLGFVVIMAHNGPALLCGVTQVQQILALCKTQIPCVHLWIVIVMVLIVS